MLIILEDNDDVHSRILEQYGKITIPLKNEYIPYSWNYDENIGKNAILAY